MFHIVFQDDQLLVLNKPSGLLAVPGRGPDLQDCLSARVQRQFPEARVVHRLDRDTSGLLVMALTAGSQRDLSAQFAARTVEKWYIAVVFDRPEAEEGTIDLPMRKDFDHPPRHMIDQQFGRPAITCWRVIDRGPAESRLELKPITGRSHQIRLHLATIGHPILGDKLYAHAAALARSPRLMLHAEGLSLMHPTTGERVAWQNPCPF
jgi:tRNA pseudouridine32 synthase/23S rRNA pseudouridine746 synthase